MPNPTVRPLPTLESLTAIFDYEPDTGHFYRKSDSGGRQLTGSRKKKGHIVLIIGKVQWYAARVAFKIMTGRDPSPGMVVDHINGNKADNRWCNLREATISQNNANKKTTAKSGHKGVYYNKRDQVWQAKISFSMHLGSFKTKDEAVAAAEAARLKHWGEFAQFKPANDNVAPLAEAA